jgi:hypothetical protein
MHEIFRPFARFQDVLCDYAPLVDLQTYLQARRAARNMSEFLVPCPQKEILEDTTKVRTFFIN